MSSRSPALPLDLDLRPISRDPIKLADSTIQRVLSLPGPSAARTRRAAARRKTAPIVSIVIVTHGGEVFTRMCLRSLLCGKSAHGLEVIIVDNASTDGTCEYLRGVAAAEERVQVVLNKENRGFAAAVNQGLARSRGESLVILNADTIMPPRWFEIFREHLNDQMIGLVGPVTNRFSNEAQVATNYQTYGGFLRAAESRRRAFEGMSRPMKMAGMFCAAMQRSTYERVGTLDERFSVGMFEDDDYSERVKRAGLKIVCTEGLLVHHFGGASFGELVPDGRFSGVFGVNRRRFEEKWNMQWQPHSHRPNADYQRIVQQVRQRVESLVPAGAVVSVVSKGDDALLTFKGRHGRHFPCQSNGTYSGHYPADDAAAIAHLREHLEAGARYFVFPGTAFWWFDHYTGLAAHLTKKGRLIHRDNDCAVYAMEGASAVIESVAALRYRGAVKQLRELAAHLLPSDAKVLVVSKGDERLLDLDGRTTSHFPQAADGRYAGHHPAGSDEAVSHLKILVRKGYQYLVVPVTSLWWLDHYEGFAQYLYDRARNVTSQKHVGAIFELPQSNGRK